MNTEVLFKVLTGVRPLSRGFKKALEKELITLSFPKNHILLEAPRVADFAYFLNKGFAISYSFVEGKKATSEFWKSGQLMLSCNSFFEQVPSMETIQLLAKSELLCISYDGVQRLFQKYPEATAVYRLIMNRYYQNIRNRIFDLQQLSAFERFEKLFKFHPDIEQIVSQDSIASYLGIAPQSLSRLKRRKSIS